MLSSAPKKQPPKNNWQIVEELAKSIPDPVRKLKFLKQAAKDLEKADSLRGHENLPSKDVPNGKGIHPILTTEKRESLSQDGASTGLTGAQRLRHFIGSMVLLTLVWCMGIMMMSFVGTVKQSAVENSVAETNPQITFYPVDVLQSEDSSNALPTTTEPSGKKDPMGKQFPAYLDKLIWQVEKTDQIEHYSNRLQIITTHTVKNIPRAYYRFHRNSSMLPAEDQVSDQIAGILYHASESDLFDFKPEMTTSIQKYSRALIKYLCKKKSYHYFIDRFGKVYRLVYDDQAAFHGGNSIWADEEWIYLNLNHAFIGICFEGKDFETVTQSKEGNSQSQPKLLLMEASSINEAQLRSGKELTDLLRVKYNIPQNNCVPHGMASVNAQTMLIGHHLDLSHSFPFEEYELNNKYNVPIPSITEFGFSYDRYFKKIFNGNLWPGIRVSEKLLLEQAQREELSLRAYRRLLNKKFNNFFKWQKKQMEKAEAEKEESDQKEPVG